jgi:cyclic 2,3-diphosphoglycerate synthetase
MRALVVVDGEHYPPVVRDALASLPYEVVACLFVGGQEKLRGSVDYAVPIVRDLDRAIAEFAPELVVDLSDEPVLGPRERLRLASRILAHGLPFEGSDFRLEPPPLEPFALPSIAVIGTGKRVGKTAVTVHLARLLSLDRSVVVVAMGRGGPADPEVIEIPPAPNDLAALSRAGRHAASDHLEIAALAGVPTIGCRRCGGGFAGAVSTSTVPEGAALAAARNPDVVIFDGSGAAIPPIAVDRRIAVVSVQQGAEVATGFLNAYRILVSDLVVVTMAAEGADEVKRAIAAVKDVPVVAATLRLVPSEPLAGRRTAVFTAGATDTAHLDADVVHVSPSLANRSALHDELRTVSADVYLVELKGAAVDVVAAAATERDADIVLAGNELVPLPGEPDLDTTLLDFAAELPAMARA